MQRNVFHPTPEQISLSGVFDALSDPMRRLMVARLSEYGELNCSCFLDCGSKTAISYHLARLREAGLTATRVEGKLHLMRLRRDDLEKRFPGLLGPVIASALKEADMPGATPPLRVSEEALKAAVKKPVAKAPAKKTARRRATIPA
jgi:DNA-binding transcriptional ArsR family regulator